MKHLNSTELTFFALGFVFIVLACLQYANNQWLPFLSTGLAFVVIGFAFMNEKKGGK